MSIKDTINYYPNIARDLAGYNPVKTASVFAGLLTKPELQSNCLRLETLVHLSLVLCKGEKEPNRKLIRKWYKRTGEGYLGLMEDPAEDSFTSVATTSLGSFNIFEGLWESGTYYLQRILNVIEQIPDGTGFNPLKNSIIALLRLSDEISKRANLTRYTFGNDRKVATLPIKGMVDVNHLEQLVCFDTADLLRLNIDIFDLEPFFFDPAKKERLSSEEVGHSTLERFPILHSENRIHLLLPSAISSTIRRFTFDYMKWANMSDVFEAALAGEYAQHLSQQHFLNLNGSAPINFVPSKNGWTASLMTQFDIGRYLHLEFVMDSLNGFAEHGFLGFNKDMESIADEIKIRTHKAIDAVKNDHDYQGGLTLVIICGYGRPFGFQNINLPDTNWKLEGISAPSTQILSWTKDFSILNFWNMLEDEAKLQSQGVSLFNMNGTLNLIAWSRKNDGHLIPHNQIPEDAGSPDHTLRLVIESNALKDLRHEFYSGWDPHCIISPEGKQTLIYKNEPSIFEKTPPPLYVSVDSAMKGEMRAVYESTTRAWWCDIRCPKDSPSDSYFQHWDMLQGWLKRAVPVIEAKLKDIPTGTISWVTKFHSIGQNEDYELPKPSIESLNDYLTVSIDIDKKVIFLEVEEAFMGAFRYPENIAEKRIVSSFVAGTIMLSKGSLDVNLCDQITDTIVPNKFARKLHYLSAGSFRDFVSSSLPRKKIIIGKGDDASTKLGLGWRVRDRQKGNNIKGKKNCTSFLNDLVQNVESEICSIIRRFDRTFIIQTLIANIEKIAFEKKRWDRTAKAILSLDGDSEFVFNKIFESKSELDAASMASRLLIEIALCESPLSGGIKAGTIDLSQLMALVMCVHHLGGWSDAIHRDAMEPKILITPLGDVHVNHDFIDSVMEPFAKVGNHLNVRQHEAEFEKNYDSPSIVPSVEDTFDEEFWQAWEQETGATIDEARIFMDVIDDWAIREHKIMLTCKRSALISQVKEKSALNEQSINNIINSFTLSPRNSWKEIPEGYHDTDRQPWRFRRRLSHIRKPLIQLDLEQNPTMIFAPGFVRDSILYVVRNFYDGSFPERQAKTKDMLKWIGRIKNKTGTEFNSEVANKLQELGWETRSDIKVTHLLRKGFDRNYGDVDVLAWNNESKTVLLIECKDLQYHKTLGEVAEQVSDFKGKIKQNGKPDLLKKHLNRMDIISQHPTEVASFVGFDSEPSIKGRLVFKNPVPIQFAWSKMKERIPLFLFDELDDIDR